MYGAAAAETPSNEPSRGALAPPVGSPAQESGAVMQLRIWQQARSFCGIVIVLPGIATPKLPRPRRIHTTQLSQPVLQSLATRFIDILRLLKECSLSLSILKIALKRVGNPYIPQRSKILGLSQIGSGSRAPDC